jgi:RNA polymerase sigma factor (sigma-70 family)
MLVSVLKFRFGSPPRCKNRRGCETIHWMQSDAQLVLTQLAPALARVVASYERDHALREELLQEVLMAVLLSLPRLTQPEKLKPFVFRIAHNRSVSHIARRMRERAYEDASAQWEPAAPSQEQQAIQAEHGERLLEAIRQLALPYRQVMTLLLEDMSYEDIADTLGISVNNVGVRVNRAKKQLREILQHD